MTQNAANPRKRDTPGPATGRKFFAGPIKVAMLVLGTAATDPRVLREATTLVEAGYEVSIVDLEKKGSHPRDEELKGISLKHVLIPPAFFSTRFDKSTLIRVTKMFVRTTTRLLQTDADLYHGHEVSGLLPCFIAAVLRRKPVIFDAHEMPLFERPLAELGWSRRFLRGLFVILLKYIVPRCAGVITVSPPIVDELRARYGLTRISLIRNIPEFRNVTKSDRLRVYTGLKQETRIVLYQGYLQPNRRLDQLIRAAAWLEPNTVIVLMGKDRQATQAQLEALIASEGVEDRVKIIPPVPYQDLLDWTSSADVGVNVANPGYSLNIQYSLPNKQFEYIMSGLPMLTSPLQAIVEIVQRYDVGQVFPSLEPTDIAAAINKILADPTGLARMSQNALATARTELYWEKEQTKLLELYQSILPVPAKRVPSW